MPGWECPYHNPRGLRQVHFLARRCKVDRQSAWELLQEFAKGDTLIRHATAVEAASGPMHNATGETRRPGVS